MNDAPTVGFIIALFASIPFAAYILPRKLSRLPVLEYQCWLGLAVAPIGILSAYMFGSGLATTWHLAFFSFLCGPIWALGSICYSLAVDNIGVARSTPIKNLAPMWASIYGIVIFGEYTIREPRALALAIGGVAMMVLAACILGRAGAPEAERALAFDARRDDTQRRRAFWLGWACSLLTSVFYGLYSIPLKFVLRSGENAYTACAWLALGVLISSAVFYLFASRQVWPPFPGWREFRLAEIAGSIWIVGQVMGTVAMLFVPMSVSWPVSNLSTLIAIGWGVWVFKEVHLDRHRREVAGSALFYFVGLLLLALAAPRGKV